MPERRALVALLALLALVALTALTALAALSLSLAPTTPAAAAGSPGPGLSPSWLFRLADPRLAELSGLAVSRRHAGVLWAHNDSGDGPYAYALGPDGRTLARLRLGAGAVARDWEAIAAGPAPRPGPPGGVSPELVPSLFLADIGDNLARHPTSAIFVTPEPARLTDATVGWTRYRFRYPDGPHDAETVLVHPVSGRIWVVTKQLAGGIYALPAHPSPTATSTVRRVGTAPTFVTDGAFSPDGSRVVLRDYATAYVYDRPGGRELARIPLPAQRQGEAVAFTDDGRALLVASEGAGTPVWRVPLPADAGTTGAASPSPSWAASLAPASGLSSGLSSSPRPAAARPSGTGWPPRLLAALGLLALAGVLALLRPGRRGARAPKPPGS